MTLSERLLAVGYKSGMRDGGKIKIEGHELMPVEEAEKFVAHLEAIQKTPAKRQPRNAVMWVERGPGGAPMVFWNDCTPAEIRDLLKAINEDGKWQMDPNT